MGTSDTASVRRLYTTRAGLYRKFFINLLGLQGQLEAFFASHDFVRPNMNVLDAGCGTGVVTRVLHRESQKRDRGGVRFYAFDLTPQMLEPFRDWQRQLAVDNVSIAVGDVLNLASLPSDWPKFDLIVCASMLEHIPNESVGKALLNLKALLTPTGRLLALVTRRTVLTIPLIGWWWRAHVYRENEIKELFESAGFTVTMQPFGRGWMHSTMAIEATTP